MQHNLWELYENFANPPFIPPPPIHLFLKNSPIPTPPLLFGTEEYIRCMCQKSYTEVSLSEYFTILGSSTLWHDVMKSWMNKIQGRYLFYPEIKFQFHFPCFFYLIMEYEKLLIVSFTFFSSIGTVGNQWYPFGTNGGMGEECTRFLKNLVEKLCYKTYNSYASTITWLRTKLSFSILKSVNVCTRGSR